ncbi:MAG: hypothetical protein Q8N35_10095 [Methylococcaceae bacterium]|nr:hypothetical protein [Methylococcaceae bacterium]MDZ4155953.1 hypothetical protein [Methylococcales bacterium]MDP2392759.1 hypothetical protein [Methylococcaceae bacterium]MDP3019929.1 hypothetical protein [Methylococcaceae bacterium]MDP3389924.1 hypothetical protein [Methylococcaceae bacterium]
MDFYNLISAFAMGAFVLGGGLLYLILTSIAVFVIIALFVIWKFRTRPLIVVPAVVILAWGIVNISINMNAIQSLPNFDFAGENAIRKKAELACENQLPQLAEAYEVDAIADTVTALSGQSIVRLLVNRQLAFIEIKVQPSQRGIQHHCPPNAKNCVEPPPSNQPYILPSTSFPDNSWTVDSAAGSYAKIELVDKSTDTCLPISSLHKSITEYLRAYPLPFNKCIKVSFNPLPTARHLLSYQAAPHPKKGLLDYEFRLGYYQLIDSKNNSVLAQLATSDRPIEPKMEMSVSTLEPGFQRPNCRTPHTVLMDRLFGTNYKDH